MEVKEVPVTVIVTGRNSETTIVPCLEALSSQDWPIDEIIVFDNGSTDSSPRLIAEFVSRAKVPVRSFDGGADGFICSAFNRGASMARSEILVLCHSDGMVPSSGELRKLVEPLVNDPSAVAAYPRLLMPREVWNRFTFWQKFLFVRAVDSKAHSRCAIFDAVRKDIYMKAGGFDEKLFYAGCGYGGEDSDAQVRFAKFGRQIETEAKVIHLHGFSPHYDFRNYLSFRSLLGRSYGKQLRWQHGLSNCSDILFFVRPFLAILPIVSICLFAFSVSWGMLCLAGSLVLQLLFAISNSKKMFTSRETLGDWRIVLVLPVTIMMIYVESFWFMHGFLTGIKKR